MFPPCLELVILHSAVLEISFSSGDHLSPPLGSGGALGGAMEAPHYSVVSHIVASQSPESRGCEGNQKPRGNGTERKNHGRNFLDSKGPWSPATPLKKQPKARIQE